MSGPTDRGLGPEAGEEAAPTTRFTTVAIGLDGSDTSWDAFWWACGEARRLGGRAVAVFVSPAADSALVAASASFVTAASAYGTIAQVSTELADELRVKAGRYALDHGTIGRAHV